MRAHAHPSPETLAEAFVDYLVERASMIDDPERARHVLRIASWTGFVVKAIKNLPATGFRRGAVHQLEFDYKNRTFGVRYHHDTSGCGGLDIVEEPSDRRRTNDLVVVRIRTLADAEDVYKTLPARLEQLLAASAPSKKVAPAGSAV